MSNVAGRNEVATGLIHRFHDDFLGLLYSSCLASFCKVFVDGFSLAHPVRFLEVDVGSLWPINHAQFGVDDDKDGQMIAGQ